MGSQAGSNQNMGKYQNLHVIGICKGEQTKQANSKATESEFN